MKVNEVMSDQVTYIVADTTLTDAARKMRDLDCGFLPIADANREKLQGVVTDRDIAIRAVADGLDPSSTTVEQVKSGKVLYCFKDDNLADAARSMHDQKVYRLIVLDDKENKNLCGVISLGDIVRHQQGDVAKDAAAGIAA